MSRRPILCFDFDGVIHAYVSGWKGARVIPDPPVPGALGYMHDMLNAGYDVAIHSSRSGHWFGRRAMRRWLEAHARPKGMWYELMNERGLEDVRFPLYKPPAFLTIDDRAFQFKGQWPSLDQLKSFKPWKAS